MCGRAESAGVAGLSWSSASCRGWSDRVEASSSSVTAPSGSDVIVDGEFSSECGGLVVAYRVVVEVAWLEDPAGGGDDSGSAGELSGYCGVGRDVVVAPFHHEPSVVLGELGSCRRATVSAW